MVEWSTVQSLLLLFGPLLYTRIVRFIRTLRRKHNLPPKPLDRSTQYLLNLLFLFSVISLLSTFPPFLPENIVALTNSHLTQTSTNLIFTRLAKIRETKPSDDFLRQRISTKEGRYLYAHYGPKVLTDCTYCTIENPDSFFYYALPQIALPHLFHILILGLVTSSGLSISADNNNPNPSRKLNNPAGKSFRIQATIAGISLALSEIYYLGYWTDYKRINSAAIIRKDVIWTHWNVIFYRGVSIAIVDGLLGYAIYLTGTNRWDPIMLDNSESPQAKVEEISKILEKSIGAINSSVCLKQTILRDRDLRNRMLQFWEREELIGKEIGEVEEIRAVRSEREKKADWQTVASEAEKRAEWIVKGLFVKRRPAEEIIEEYERNSGDINDGAETLEEQLESGETGIDEQREIGEEDELPIEEVDNFDDEEDSVLEN